MGIITIDIKNKKIDYVIPIVNKIGKKIHSRKDLFSNYKWDGKLNDIILDETHPDYKELKSNRRQKIGR